MRPREFGIDHRGRSASRGPDSGIGQAGATAIQIDDPAARARLKGIVEGILAAWDTHDVVCLGEGHGSKLDSDLRIALVEHPDFVRKVDVIMVEFANPVHQDILDRLAVDAEDLPRAVLSAVWRDTTADTVWESPVYEAFLRAVRGANLKVPRERRVRLLGGDTPIDWTKIRTGRDLLPWMNRGKSIREAVAREILDRKLKGLAIYGSGHCECRGMGFPGELGDAFPGRIRAVFGFYGKDAIAEGRRVFGLGADPTMIRISGTEKEKIPAGKMFFTGRLDDPAPLGDIVDEIVYFGDVEEVLVPVDERTVDPAYRAELERRSRIRGDAADLIRKKK